LRNEDGIISVQDLIDKHLIDKEVLEMIGYRVPTEGYSSMHTLRITGFLPRSSGSNIQLPSKWLEFTGSDFDIDSVYFWLKNYKFDEETGALEVLPSNRDSKENRDNAIIDVAKKALSRPEVIEQRFVAGGFQAFQKIKNDFQEMYPDSIEDDWSLPS